MSFEKKTLLHSVRRALSLRALLTIYIQCMYIVQEDRHSGVQTDTSETDRQAEGKQAGTREKKDQEKCQEGAALVNPTKWPGTDRR